MGVVERLIARAGGDDVIVSVRMRRSSFAKLCASPVGRSVPVGGGMIGLVPAEDRETWVFVVWSPEPVWRGVPEQIPANQDAADALAGEAIR